MWECEMRGGRFRSSLAGLFGLSGLSSLFRSLNQTNQTNQTDQMNQMDQTPATRREKVPDTLSFSRVHRRFHRDLLCGAGQSRQLRL